MKKIRKRIRSFIRSEILYRLTVLQKKILCIIGQHHWTIWHEPIESIKLNGSDINEKWEHRKCIHCKKVEERGIYE